MADRLAADFDAAFHRISSESALLQETYDLGLYYRRHAYSELVDSGGQEDSYPLNPVSSTKQDRKVQSSKQINRRAPTKVQIVANRVRDFYRRWVLRSGPVGYEELSPTYNRLVLGLDGWRLGVLVSAAALVFCLAAEIALLIAANTIRGVDRAQSILYNGDCEKVKRYTFYALIPFNIVGTLMIGCSNYVMQILCAPSRKEIDAAHNHAQDLNIGVSSAQNHMWIGERKKLLWWVLGITTVPIHLLLNSVVFATLQSNVYNIVIVGQDFFDGSHNATCTAVDKFYNATFNSHQDDDETVRVEISSGICYVRNEYLTHPDLYETMELDRCMERYRNPLQGTASNLVLITNGSETIWNEAVQGPGSLNTDGAAHNGQLPMLINSTHITGWQAKSFTGNFTGFSYKTIVQTGSSLYKELPNGTYGSCTSTWVDKTATIACNDTNIIQNLEVQQCLSKQTQEHCTMQYNLGILICILVCDVAKFVAMLMILRQIFKRKGIVDKDDEIIAVLGDAVASFLDRPDETSLNRCLFTQRQIRSATRLVDTSSRLEPHPDNPFWRQPLEVRTARFPMRFGPRPQVWKSEQHRWAMGPSRTRWSLFIGLFVILFAAVGIIFGFSLGYLGDRSLRNIWDQGVGKVDPSNVFAPNSFNSSLIRGVLVVNIPQLLFSYLYFAYNGLFTCMHAGYEWSQLANPTRRRPLRVSTPNATQRSTYWLSLPWRYSIPLIGVSTLLHWLVSRSLFLVKVDVYDAKGQHDSDNDIAACGFSPLALVLVLFTLVVMLGVVAGFATRKLQPGIPVVGTCSWAIAANCHDIGGEANAAEKPLMWGVIQEAGDDRPGHCSVTSRVVAAPIEGKVYQ